MLKIQKLKITSMFNIKVFISPFLKLGIVSQIVFVTCFFLGTMKMNGNGNGAAAAGAGGGITKADLERLIAAASQTAPAQTIRFEQGPIKIVTDQPPYKM